jgi:hypothetical protein
MDRFTPIAVVVTVLMDIGLNSLLEPVSAHISVVILLTCLQVQCFSSLHSGIKAGMQGGEREKGGRGSARARTRQIVCAHTRSLGSERAAFSTARASPAPSVGLRMMRTDWAGAEQVALPMCALVFLFVMLMVGEHAPGGAVPLQEQVRTMLRAGAPPDVLFSGARTAKRPCVPV